MREYHVGDIVSCKVTGIQEYGIFVLVGDHDGLIHISEISDLYVRSVSDYAKVGDVIKAKVIGFDEANNKLKLSIKNIKYKKGANKKQKIQETKNGFSTLRLQMSSWIKEKLGRTNNANKE